MVRDQGVGGSNPLSPTNCLHTLTFTANLKKSSTWFCPRCSSAKARINADVIPREGSGTVYKIDYRDGTDNQVPYQLTACRPANEKRAILLRN
jgi:hypothetical protein